MHRIKEAMLLLIANDAPLGPEWLDHALGGDWDGHSECHIGGDFLLAYKLDDSSKHGLIVFVRAGTRADLFEQADTNHLLSWVRSHAVSLFCQAHLQCWHISRCMDKDGRNLIWKFF